ncbi:hypothetical protein LTS10_012599 [Elasticomyces elasticus]|nr:hypothetical protein LTS10_012599 [Elasticomyces elasticus]
MFKGILVGELGFEGGCATPVLDWNENGSIFDEPVSEELHIEGGSILTTGAEQLDLEGRRITLSAGRKWDSSNSTLSGTLSEQLGIQGGCTVIGAGMGYDSGSSTLSGTASGQLGIKGGNTSIPTELNSWTPHWHIFDNQGRAVGFRTYDPEEPVWTPRQFAESSQMHDRCAFEDGGAFDPRLLLQQPEWRALHPFRLQEDVDAYVEATGRRDEVGGLGPRASVQRFSDGRNIASRHRDQDVRGPQDGDGDEVVYEWLEAQRGHGVQSPPTPALTEHELLDSGPPQLVPEHKAVSTSESCDLPDPLATEEYLLACAVEWKGMGLEERREMVSGHFGGARSVGLARGEMLGLLPLGEENVGQTSGGVLEEIVQGNDMCTYVPRGDPGMPGSASPTRSEMEAEPEQQRSSVPAQRVTPPGNRLPAVKRWNGRPALQPRAGLGSNSGMTPEEWVEHRRKGKNESQKMKRREQRERKAGKV